MMKICKIIAMPLYNRQQKYQNCNLQTNFVSCNKIKEMVHLAINSKILDKYFGFLVKLDNSSKKRLIIKLTESIEIEEEKELDLNLLYGAWEDDRDSDEIIKEIRDSRIENWINRS